MRDIQRGVSGFVGFFSSLRRKLISKPLLRSPEVRVCTVGKMEKFMLGTQMQKNLRGRILINEW